MSSLLEVRDVCVRFSGVVAVDHVSLAVKAGGLYGLVGPNGSGKTTMLGAISRLVELSSGRLFFDGHEYTRASADSAARLGIARSFQAIRLVPSLNVLQNVMLGADLVASNGERASRDAAYEVLKRLDLQHVASMDPGNLPYGIQRRVEIARAMATHPRLLLLDEPAAGMNQSESQAVAELLKVVAHSGVTIVLVEHNLRMVMGICEHIFVMNFGRLIASGDVPAVTADALVREAYLGKKHVVTA